VQDWRTRGLLTTPTERPAVPESSSLPRSGSIWVILESGEDGVRPACLDLLAHAARRAVDLQAAVTAIVLGPAVESSASTLASWGADQILLAEAPDLGPQAVEAHAVLLRQAIVRRTPDILLLPATAYGRELAARLSAPLGLGIVTDCSDFEPDNGEVIRLLRPSFHGDLAAVTCAARPILATMTPGAQPRSSPLVSRRASIERLSWRGDFLPRRRTLAVEASTPEAIALESAEIVFGAGMGIGSPEGVAHVQALASRLGAGVAASRRVVDAGWLPRQLQVGLTGRIIAPRLYLAIGVNGNSYHAAGVQRAGWIAAINTDPSPGLFSMADDVLQGDWQIVLAPLVELLTESLPPAAA
jgi:electron transfer flavoprotein alpha subunit